MIKQYQTLKRGSGLTESLEEFLVVNEFIFIRIVVRQHVRQAAVTVQFVQMISVFDVIKLIFRQMAI